MLLSVSLNPLFPVYMPIVGRLRGAGQNLLGRALRGVAGVAGRLGGAISRRAGAAARRLGQ